MGRRIDYYNDSNAPKANSLIPAVNVVVENDNGEVLMIRRTDNDNWALPGGAIDLGESVAHAAIRETKEETGLDVEITDVVGIYSDPGHVIHYTSDNEVRQEFSILLKARSTGGALRTSEESREVRWVGRAQISNRLVDRSMQLRLRDYFNGREWPLIR